MYWPNGVPRVHAVNGPGIQLPEVDDNASGDREQAEGEGGADDARDPLVKGGEDLRTEDDKWEEEPITGLCVSKSGHLFVSMTQSSLTVWQTKVCRILSNSS